MKKIIVPVDFSSVSKNAFSFAIEVAKKYQSSITLVHSIHSDFSVAMLEAQIITQPLVERIKAETQKKLDELIDEFKDEQISVDSRISRAGLTPFIKGLVEKDNYDLVVMGTTGCSGLAEILIGSNTEKVVRSVKCPVISVPDVAFREINEILIPVHLEEIRSSFLKEIASIQKVFDCHLAFVWVKTPHNIENEEKVREEFREIIKMFGIKNYTFKIVNNIFPSDGIFLEAEESDADMVAMPTHARKGIAHFFSGSLTEDSINHIKLPVLSFKIDKNEEPIELGAVRKAAKQLAELVHSRTIYV